jgi:hypothetical protein
MLSTKTSRLPVSEEYSNQQPSGEKEGWRPSAGLSGRGMSLRLPPIHPDRPEVGGKQLKLYVSTGWVNPAERYRM